MRITMIVHLGIVSRWLVAFLATPFLQVTPGATVNLVTSYFSERRGLMLMNCLPFSPVKRTDCAFRCIASQTCKAFVYIQSRSNPANRLCGSCQVSKTVSLSQGGGHDTITSIYLRSNAVADNPEGAWRFVLLPNGLRAGDFILVRAVPDGHEYSLMFLDGEWTPASSEDGLLTSVKCDLAVFFRFVDGQPTSVDSFNSDVATAAAVSQNWTGPPTASEYIPSHPTPFLEVGREAAMTLWVKSANSYQLTINEIDLGEVNRPPGVQLSQVRYLRIPPIVTQVRWYDQTL